MERDVPRNYGWKFLGVFDRGERETFMDFPFAEHVQAGADLEAREFWLVSDASFPADTLAHSVCDLVLPKLLSWDGRFVLHSGMVSEGVSAIGFLGQSGAGKSTLTAAFVRNGARLLSDDTMVIYPEVEPLGARPLYSGLRMFPDSITELLPDAPLGENMAHYSSKRRLMVEESMEMAHPRALFLLENAPEAKTVELRDMSPADACMTLLRNSFALDPTNRTEAARRFALASDMARRVPIYTLTYPRRYEALPEVIDNIRSVTKL